MPLVALALAARIKLTQRLAASLAAGSATVEGIMSTIDMQLQSVFPTATVTIVQDLYSGFRVKEGEYILLVEVANSGELDGLSVVKLGPVGALQREITAWNSCRPPGLRHDIVLMDLRSVPNDTAPTALVYADAEQLIGVDRTQTLEDAMLDAVRTGDPDVQSVTELLFQLYERLGLLLYKHSSGDDHRQQTGEFDATKYDRHWHDNVDAWYADKNDCLLVRRDITSELEELNRTMQFRDSAYFFRWIAQQKNARQYVPRVLWGRSHGDLHGRNVLVGRVGSQVLWPAVYDFEHMSPMNLIGIDFVKMETEFKVRAYQQLFPAEQYQGRDFTTAVLNLEIELDEITKRARRNGTWPTVSPQSTDRDRFKRLVLCIRKLAERHLSKSGRGGLWLMEYYFLLALYGLNAARFDNLSTRERKAAFLASGCAAARYAPLPIEGGPV